MQRIFLDSDVILDLFAKRIPFYDAAAKLFSLVDSGKIKAFTSPIVFTNLHYILKKYKSANFAIQSLQKLRVFVNVLPINEKIVDESLASSFPDYEDALQFYTARENNIGFIITRNKKDYKKSTIPVCSTDEFLNIFGQLNS